MGVSHLEHAYSGRVIAMSSTQRTFDLLELLATRGPMGTRSIARLLELPSGSMHRLLHELEQASAVSRLDGGEWEISHRLMQIAGLHLRRLELPRLARGVLEELSDRTKETAFLAVQSGNEIVYIDKVQSSTELQMQLQLNVELGARRPIHCTALGKALLAFQSESRQERLIAHGDFSASTPKTITDPILMRQELQRIRSRGYATDQEEILIGVSCIAVPILDHSGRPVGAISIAGPSPNFSEQRVSELVSRVLAAGQEISNRLGYIAVNDHYNPAAVHAPAAND